MKLALVVQRYGREIAGGSEAHCRAIARRLARHHEVTVLTSCAKDYITWRNEYPAGPTAEDGVRILRFRAGKRRQHRFRDISEIAFSGTSLPAEEEAWFVENGPRVPGLIEHLKRHGRGYDGVLFWTFRYYPSYFGLPEVAERAILLPTAEEDQAIRFAVLRKFFRSPAGILFLTEEEKELVEERAGGALPPFRIIGSGLEPATGAPGRGPLSELGLDGPYVLYLGRIDPNKGCRTLLLHYLRYLEHTDRSAPLVLAGKPVMELPSHPLIRALGFVSDELRQALIANASFLVMPSRFESLSLVLLEAWNHGRPVLVNAHCRVLKGQVTRANGGLYYHDSEEFAEAAELLLGRPEVADRLGGQGLDYVGRHYRWPVVMAKIEELLATLEGK